MTETLSNTCCETGRTFATAEEARASEERFREIQAACDAGGMPELRKGDVIYVDTELYLHHGRDDFRGGLAEVAQFGVFIRSSSTPFVRVVQEPDTQHNWEVLAPMQKKLRQEFGKNWAHPDPDNRPEFNED
ncbi:MAG TPA: hypothetical protein VKW06_05270 [Candidatus Angelobacter sp.]|nr:hypothetical protein [Candidatus Angelobacter sp.]